MSVLVRVLALMLAVAAPGLALAESYAQPWLVAAILAGWAGAAVGCTVVLSWRSASPLALLGGLPVAFLGVAGMALLLPGPQDSVLAGTFDAIAHSGARVLTTSVPTSVAVDTLTLPALATWLSGAAATLAARERRPLLAGACVLPPLLGVAALNGVVAAPGYLPMALYAVAVVLLLAATPAPESSPAGSAGLAQVNTVTTASAPVGSWPRRIRAAVARPLTVVTLGSAIAVLIAYLGPFALYGSGIHPAEVRSTVDPPEEEDPVLNPLGYLSAWTTEPDQPLFDVHTSEPTEMRWVALSEFTGVTWIPDSAYRSSGSVLPEPEVAVPNPRARTVEVTVTDLPGAWLPVPGTPLRLEGPAISYDPESGTVRTDDGEAAGLDYTVTSAVPQWEPEDLREADLAEGSDLDSYRELAPDAPDTIPEIAAAVADDGTPYEQANRLAAHLRDNYTLDPQAPGGHGYANLDDLLVAPGEPAGAGTSEQFASAFALLARQAGLPSRVMVGFAPSSENDEDSDDGAYTVRTGDAVAWGEVYLAEIGWVPFDVTPGSESPDTGAEAAEDHEEEETAEEPNLPIAEEDEHNEPWSSWSAGSGIDWDGLWTALARVGAAVLLLSVGILALIPLLRLRTRHRRLEASDPLRRVFGAWWELRDALALAGHPARATETVTEVLTRADTLVPSAQPAGQWTLGTLVNQLAFYPRHQVQPVTNAAATRAVVETRSYVRALLSTQPRSRRVLWWLDPRPLFWLRR